MRQRLFTLLLSAGLASATLAQTGTPATAAAAGTEPAAASSSAPASAPSPAPAPADGSAPAGAVTSPVSSPSSPAKRELVARLLRLQLPGVEALARNLVEQPAARLLQDASRILQTQVPAAQREAVSQRIEASAKQYLDDAVPALRDRAVALAPSTLGSMLETRFTEDELRQLLTWYESPTQRKYQQLLPEMQNGFVQQLVADGRPVIDPKLQAFEQALRTALGEPPASAAAPASAPAPSPASAPTSSPNSGSRR